MKIGYFRVDGWRDEYIIPEELIEDYDKLEKEIKETISYDVWDKLVNLYYDKYNQYKMENFKSFKIIMEE